MNGKWTMMVHCDSQAAFAAHGNEGEAGRKGGTGHIPESNPRSCSGSHGTSEREEHGEVNLRFIVQRVVSCRQASTPCSDVRVG